MRAITSRRHRIVAAYREAAHGDSPDALLLDGPHLVADALAAGVTIRHAAVRTDRAREGEVAALLDRLARADVEVAPVSAPVMAALSPVRTSSGIVALADCPRATLDRVYGGASPLVAIAVDVQDPGNMGALIRVAEAAGATGIVAAGGSANPYGWKALRGSMGSSLRLPIVVQADPETAIRTARTSRCRVVAALPRDGRSLYDLDYTVPLAILIGGEGPGLPPEAIAAADERVTIPMKSPVESLNTAVATALLLYEARRQRG